MDTIMGVFTGGLWLLVGLIILVLAVGGGLFYKMRYKIANADQALVITGAGKGKEARILPGGGAFVPPTRKSNFFPLSVMTVRSDDQETHTSEMIPVVVKWTAQLRADVETSGALEKAVRGFGSYDTTDISNSLKQTLDGEVRAVVATMTPEQVITDKVEFANHVMQGVSPRMEELGFKLVSLNISEVSDRNDHYDNLAARERENKRQEAATLAAEAQKAIDIKNAETKRESTEADLVRDLAIEEKTREVTLRKAAILAETDTAEADAAIAGELQREIRHKELATRRGEVAVVQAKQDEEAAAAQRAAALTRAETERQRKTIEAQAEADRLKIEAEAKAEKDKTEAQAQSDAERIKAEGEANALDAMAEAKADDIRKIGLAAAEVEQAKGEAEAAAILAKGKAEAEAERELAEARAAYGGVNTKVEIAKINATARVEIATAFGTAMHEVGKNVTILQTGASGGSGNLLSSLLGDLPSLAKELDVKSDILNDASFNETLSGLVGAFKGEPPVATPAEEDTPPSEDDTPAPKQDIVAPRLEPLLSEMPPHGGVEVEG